MRAAASWGVRLSVWATYAALPGSGNAANPDANVRHSSSVSTSMNRCSPECREVKEFLSTHALIHTHARTADDRTSCAWSTRHTSYDPCCQQLPNFKEVPSLLIEPRSLPPHLPYPPPCNVRSSHSLDATCGGIPHIVGSFPHIL